jgi:transposase
MAKQILPDHLWSIIQPLLPPRPDQSKGGGQWRDDRAVLTGILFILRTGIAWQDLPGELDYGSGSTCWRRLRDWQKAGVWERVHQALLDRLRAGDRLVLKWAAIDSSSVRALKGGDSRGAIQPIEEKQARSIILWLTDEGYRLRRQSRRRTRMIPRWLWF